jgi:tetratricopeptide (TPR) repeat protein
LSLFGWHVRFISIRLDPSHRDARSNLGAALARLGRFEEAVEEYRQVLESDPDQAAVRFNLGLALYKSAQVEAAATEFRQVVGRDPSPPAELLLLADCHRLMGHDRRVVELLAPHEAELGDDRLFAYLLGNALIHEGDLARGQAWIDRLFRDGESAEGHLLLGAQHIRRDNFQGALPELERAVEMSPELAGAHSMLGIALLGTGDREDAARAFRRELRTNPNDFEANLHLGLLLREEDRLDEATDYLRRAERLRPRHPDVLYGLGRIQLARGDLEAAEQTLEQLTRAVPDYEAGHVLLASVYYRQDRRELGDREHAIVEELRAERRARELGEPTEDASGEPAVASPPGTEDP